MEFRWNEEKNNVLERERGICFDDILHAIEHWDLLGIEKHPRQDLYPWQRILFVKINNYVYMIPAILEWPHSYFLKTIFPSRKATKRFISSP